jgi:hypothetical protein
MIVIQDRGGQVRRPELPKAAIAGQRRQQRVLHQVFGGVLVMILARIAHR